jgi:peptidoglycan/xylan/chitin deacetylase (PgdA/CDA1 family)
MTLSISQAAKAVLQQLYTPGRFLWRLPSAQTTVALTFDDGPDPLHTPAVLDVLAAFGVKATFFLVGEKAAKHPELVQRMAQEGHQIGGHTWAHREIVGMTNAELDLELTRCRDIIAKASGIDSRLFRPPRGRVDLASIRRVCGQGYCLVHWTKTYSDYKKDGIENLLRRFRGNRPVARDIVLLHDHNEDTVAAMRTLIPEWQAAGITFSALPD